jgi:hypothetical protein
MKQSLMACAAVSMAVSGWGQTPPQAPEWVTEGKRIMPADVPAADYRYLTSWLEANAKPADDYFLSLYKRHDVVVFGEGHNVREHKDFIIGLVPRLYHEAEVRVIGWEFSNPLEQSELDRLISMRDSDPEAVLNFARGHLASWNSKEHWDIIEAVRRLNASLPKGKPGMRLVGIDIPKDWHDLYVAIKTTPKDSPEGADVKRWYMTRDEIMAENAERATFQAGVKGLLFVGRGHAETHFGLPPDPPFPRPIMAQVLHRKYAERLFQVTGDWGVFGVVQKAMAPLGHRAVGFDMYASPFASILSTDVATTYLPMSVRARGYVYFGNCQQLHRNTSLRGFVTEATFEKHRHYFEVDFNREFKSAQEVDDYLAERNWKLRCPEPLLSPGGPREQNPAQLSRLDAARRTVEEAHAVVDALDPRLFRRERRLRSLEQRRPARDLPLHPRARHGRRVDDRATC